VVSVISGVATRACLFVCLNVSFSHHTCSCLRRWSLRINYYLGGFTALQFSCWVELCGSLLWFPILPVLHPSFPTPHRKWFMVELHQVSLSTEVPSVTDGVGWWLLAVPAGPPSYRVAMEPPCCAGYFCRTLINLW